MWEPILAPDPPVINLDTVRRALEDLPVVVRGYDPNERILCLVWSLRAGEVDLSRRDIESAISTVLEPLARRMPGARRFAISYSALPLETLKAS